MSENILSKQTLTDLIPGFVLERRTRGLAPRSISNYRTELDLFAAENKTVAMQQVTPTLIRTYLDHLAITRNRGGIHAAWRVIRAFFNWYAREFEPEGWTNPASKVHVTPPLRQALPGVTLENIQKLLDACDTGNSVRDKAIILTLLDSGLRATELISLDLDDLDIVTGALTVRHGKGAKRRTVYLGSRTRKAVRKYLKSHSDTEPLFLTDSDERFAYDGLNSLIRRRATDAGIPRPRLHDFRRAFAINMLRNGCDLARLAALLGHTTLAVTILYLHLVDDDLRLAHAQSSPADRL
jgi:site-specific recombinase XerD